MTISSPTTTPVVSADHVTDSPLDHPFPQFEDRPFFNETVALLRSVRDHDFDTLAALCEDDYGIIDVDAAGQPRPIRTRDEWEAWFHELFATLGAMQARTDSDVTDYHATATDELGYSVLEFRQFLSVGELTATFDCIATIVWKRTADGWREARWHASVVDADVPEALRAAA